MVVTTFTLLLGLSSIVLLLIGYTYSVLFLVKYFYVKKILVPIVAMVAFCCGGFYLGPSVSFIHLLITGDNISGELYYYLSYALLPVGTMGIVIMALNVIKPKWQKPAIIFYGMLSILFWIFMFGFTDQQFDVSTGELLDIGHAGVSRIVAAISLLSILCIDSLGFFLLSLKFKKLDLPKRDVRKAFMIGLGWFLFFFSGTIDALFPPDTIEFILLLRALMVIAFNLIYIGFWSKPTRLEE